MFCSPLPDLTYLDVCTVSESPRQRTIIPRANATSSVSPAFFAHIDGAKDAMAATVSRDLLQKYHVVQ